MQSTIHATARPKGACEAKLQRDASTSTETAQPVPKLTAAEVARMEADAAANKIPSSVRNASLHRKWKDAFIFTDEELQKKFDCLPGYIF